MILFAAFFSGITAATFAAAGLFFARFWLHSRDRFFLWFGIACWLIALERFFSLFIHETLLPVRSTLEGPGTWIYLIRLLAFGFILLAVIGKRRAAASKGG